MSREVRVNVCLNPIELVQLDTYCEKEEILRSTAIRAILLDFLYSPLEERQARLSRGADISGPRSPYRKSGKYAKKVITQNDPTPV